MEVDYEVSKPENRVLMQVTCRECGEKFFVRATRDGNGDFETGVKMCLCGNEDVEITPAK